MSVFYDQLGRAVSLPDVPKRIISIVPSQTELLFDLGLEKEVIGITKFCIHPKDITGEIAKVGGTKQLDMELISRLKPHLIIANKEENEQGKVEELMRHYPVWISDIHNLPAALAMIAAIGDLVGRKQRADALLTMITQRFDGLALYRSSLRVAYFIWRKPYMVAGKDTFIDSMLQICGFTNAVDKNRYPELTTADIIALKPDVILLSSEPYPFKQKHIDEFRRMHPDAQIKLIDGEMFSWYGSRLQFAPAYFTGLVNELNKINPK